MRQEERREQTIQLLLSTTKQLISEKGCDLVTLQDIMERSGLSKGAIFHYVNSKDEIFAWVLQERLEDINLRFQRQVDKRNKNLEDPLQEITSGIHTLMNAQEVTNQVLVYLLAKKSKPEIDEVLKQFYEQSISLSQHWIKTGQEHGVIPESVDMIKMGELFVLISLGLRIRSFLPTNEVAFQSEDFTMLLKEILSGKK